MITVDRSNSISQRHSYNPCINNGLGLAKYILRELKNNKIPDINFGINQFGDNIKFVKSILEFLKEMEWISLDKQGEYRITEAGCKNPLDNLKF